MLGNTPFTAKHYIYYPVYPSSPPSSSSSVPPSSPPTTSSPSSSAPSSPSTTSAPLLQPLMLSVVYPSAAPMYVQSQAQQPYYYVQSSSPAGQWSPAGAVTVPQNGAPNGYFYQQRPPAQVAYTVVPQQQQQPQQQLQLHPQRVRTASMAVVPQQMTSQLAPQPTTIVKPPQQLAPVPIRSNSYPPTRPPLQRKFSTVSMRRGSFDSVGSDGISVDEDPLGRPASPVFSDSTFSSSSSGSSSSSHMNLSRSALNHYTVPQRQRRMSRGAIDYNIPLGSRSSTLCIAPPPQQPQPLYSQPTGLPVPMAPRKQPQLVKSSDLSGRPISFHEDQQVYSSYELYQPPPQRTGPPTIQPRSALKHRRSLSAVGPELSASAYGTGLGVGGPGVGIDYGSGKKWWKR